MIEGRSQCQRCGRWFKTGDELRRHLEACRPQVALPRRRPEQARFGTLAEALKAVVPPGSGAERPEHEPFSEGE